VFLKEHMFYNIVRTFWKTGKSNGESELERAEDVSVGHIRGRIERETGWSSGFNQCFRVEILRLRSRSLRFALASLRMTGDCRQPRRLLVRVRGPRWA
jgi:hypothetical protein